MDIKSFKPLTLAYTDVVVELLALLNYHVDYRMNRFLDGYIIRFNDSSYVKIHSNSIGHEKGLFEAYSMTPDFFQSVGNMTAEEIIRRLKVSGLYTY